VAQKCSLEKSSDELHAELMLLFKERVQEGWVAVVQPMHELQERFDDGCKSDAVSATVGTCEEKLTLSAAQWAELGFGPERTPSGWETIFRAEISVVTKGRAAMSPTTPRHTRRGYRRYKRSTHLHFELSPRTSRRPAECVDEKCAAATRDEAELAPAADGSAGAQRFLESDSSTNSESGR